MTTIPEDLQGAGVLIRTIKDGDDLRFPKSGDVCLVRTLMQVTAGIVIRR